jgi:hypothetical protein
MADLEFEVRTRVRSRGEGDKSGDYEPTPGEMLLEYLWIIFVILMLI